MIFGGGWRAPTLTKVLRSNSGAYRFVVVWNPDSKTENGIAEVPLTELAVEALREQIRISGEGTWLFPSDQNPKEHQNTLKTVWRAVLRRAKVPYFRIHDLRSTYAIRLSPGGVADEWVTQLLWQGNAKVFKKYSQIRLQMKREALEKMNRQANESEVRFDTERLKKWGSVTVLPRSD
jgi:integrase